MEGTTQEAMMNLGAWLGRHQAFGMIAKRCTAADAECLKAIRDGGEYKQLGLTWERFCEEHAGVSRVEANRLIHYLEEFGANYFRIGELVPISPDTYRLIAGAVSDEGIEIEGERIPLARENRNRIQAAVKSIRARQKERPAADTDVLALRRRFNGLVDDAIEMAQTAEHRMEVLVLFKESQGRLERLAEEIRANTLVVE